MKIISPITRSLANNEKYCTLGEVEKELGLVD
jgi:hypothetical protein